MPNKRISDFQERKVLYSDSATEPFPHAPRLNDQSLDDNETLFLLARPKVQNETITYPDLKSNILDNSIYLTGSQLVSGQKIFTDKCTFLSRTNINEVIDSTFSGDISGNIFVGESGLLQSLKIGTDFFERKSDFSSYTAHISGDSCFLGDITLTGDNFQEGDSSRIGDSNQIGFAHISGNKTITENLYAQQNIFCLYDDDTFIKLKNQQIDIEAGVNTRLHLIDDEDDRIVFYTNNEEQMRLYKNPYLAINNTDPMGELSVTGKAFIQDIFTYDHFSKKFNRVYGGDDENVYFKTKLRKGKSQYKINLPKTFKLKPVMSVMLENTNGGVIIPLIISNITRHDFLIDFAKELEDDNYILHTMALSTSIEPEVDKTHYDHYPHVVCSDNSAGRQHSQRFYTPIQEVSDTVEITFPFNYYKDTPSVSVTIEGPNNIVPHAISSVNNRSYKIIFGTQVDSRYTIHTFSSIEETKRLG
jgi:hypothetical protein